jgi:hypothetical protein
MWYYEHWLAKYGLTMRQESLLEKYRGIRKKYPWGQMEPIFMYADTLEDAWERASSRLIPDEVKCLKGIFAAFKENFDREWQDHEYLHRKKEAYETMIGQYNIDSAFREVQHFYDVADFDQEIDVHLLYNPSKGSGGGSAHAGIQSEERQDEREESIITGISGLLHEAFHLFEPRRRIEKASVKFNLGNDEWEIVAEAAMDSLVPYGIITKKFLHKNRKRDAIRQIDDLQRRLRMVEEEIVKKRILITLIRTKLCLALLPVTQAYLEQGKTVWDNYWRKASEQYFQIKEAVQRLPISSDSTYIV